jgi:hypothetical protein
MENSIKTVSQMTTNKLHPLVAVASVAAIIASVVILYYVFVTAPKNQSALLVSQNAHEQALEQKLSSVARNACLQLEANPSNASPGRSSAALKCDQYTK